jgi:hypothetical protein
MGVVRSVAWVGAVYDEKPKDGKDPGAVVVMAGLAQRGRTLLIPTSIRKL